MLLIPPVSASDSNNPITLINGDVYTRGKSGSRKGHDQPSAWAVWLWEEAGVCPGSPCWGAAVPARSRSATSPNLSIPIPGLGRALPFSRSHNSCLLLQPPEEPEVKPEPSPVEDFERTPSGRIRRTSAQVAVFHLQEIAEDELARDWTKRRMKDDLVPETKRVRGFFSSSL